VSTGASRARVASLEHHVLQLGERHAHALQQQAHHLQLRRPARRARGGGEAVGRRLLQRAALREAQVQLNATMP